MSEWDNQGISPQSKRPTSSPSHGWNVMLTITSLIMVATFSFFIAFLTRNMENRPFYVMAAYFGVPAAAMFISALMLESEDHPMLPSTSRSVQVRVAALAVAGTILVGGLCDAIYVYGGFAA